jgi:ABC-type multidrug transport system ATPase subunit
MDEPTAGLDPQSRLALWEILTELNADGQTILLTTHYMEEADQLCDRVAIMDHGKILALDTPAALKQSVGADTIVTVKATGDRSALRSLKRDIDGVTRPARSTGGSSCTSRAPTGSARGRGAPRRGLRDRRPGGRRADARDRLHQPHRQGVARLMTDEHATIEVPSDRSPRARPSRPHARRSALILRDLVVLRKTKREFVSAR